MSRTDARVLVRLAAADGPIRVLRAPEGEAVLEGGLAGLLALPLADARAALDAAVAGPRIAGAVLAPVDEQEVWAAGVTDERSRHERMAESTRASIYDLVSAAERPEVRSIEGENPLHLPQAKVDEAACALGPAIVPAWTVTGPFAIGLVIERGGEVACSGTTSSAALTRTAEDLAAWLMTAMPFPAGCVLLTGTGVVPHESFTLQEDDVVRITVEGIGELVNPVRVVGRDLRAGRTGAGA